MPNKINRELDWERGAGRGLQGLPFRWSTCRGKEVDKEGERK